MNASDPCQTEGCHHRRDEHAPLGCFGKTNNGSYMERCNCASFTEPPTVAEPCQHGAWHSIEGGECAVRGCDGPTADEPDDLDALIAEAESFAAGCSRTRLELRLVDALKAERAKR